MSNATQPTVITSRSQLVRKFSSIGSGHLYIRLELRASKIYLSYKIPRCTNYVKSLGHYHLAHQMLIILSHLHALPSSLDLTAIIDSVPTAFNTNLIFSALSTFVNQYNSIITDIDSSRLVSIIDSTFCLNWNMQQFDIVFPAIKQRIFDKYGTIHYFDVDTDSEEQDEDLEHAQSDSDQPTTNPSNTVSDPSQTHEDIELKQSEEPPTVTPTPNTPQSLQQTINSLQTQLNVKHNDIDILVQQKRKYQNHIQYQKQKILTLSIANEQNTRARNKTLKKLQTLEDKVNILQLKKRGQKKFYLDQVQACLDEASTQWMIDKLLSANPQLASVIVGKYADTLQQCSQSQLRKDHQSWTNQLHSTLRFMDNRFTQNEIKTVRSMTTRELQRVVHNGTLTLQTRSSRWNHAGLVNGTITHHQARKVQDSFMHSLLNGIVCATIDFYAHLTNEEAEFAVFHDVALVAVEFYMKLITATTTIHYISQHSLDIATQRLSRRVDRALICFADGAQTSGVYHGHHTTTLGIKWSGNKTGFQAATNMTTITLLSSQSENDQTTQQIIRNEFKRLEQIRDYKQYAIRDAMQREHIIDFSTTVIIKLMDVKLLRIVLNYIGASQCGPDPMISIWRKCTLTSQDEFFPIEQEYSFHGYHQTSVWPSDLLKLSEYLVYDGPNTMHSIGSFIDAHCGDGDNVRFIAHTNVVALRCKIDILNRLWTEHAATLDEYDEHIELQWRKKTAKELFLIHFHSMPNPDDLEYCQYATLHLYARNVDQFNRYLSINRSVFNSDTMPEFDAMASIPELYAMSETYKKLHANAPQNSTIRLNFTGDKMKALLPALDTILLQRMLLINNDDSLNMDEKNLRKTILCQLLYYLECTCKFLKDLRVIYDSANAAIERRARLVEKLQEGINIICYMANNLKWLLKPTTLSTIVCMPLCYMKLCDIEIAHGIRISINEISDQWNENIVQQIKKRFAANNDKRRYQTRRIMDGFNFLLWCKLSENLFYTQRSENDVSSSSKDIWFGDQYAMHQYDRYCQTSMKNLRSLTVDEEVECLFYDENLVDVEAEIEAKLQQEYTEQDLPDSDDDIECLDLSRIDLNDNDQDMDSNHNRNSQRSNSQSQRSNTQSQTRRKRTKSSNSQKSRKRKKPKLMQI